MSDDGDEITDDFADLVGEDSILDGNAKASGPPSLAPNKPSSGPPSKPTSKAPSELSADDSLFASGSRQGSRPASKAPSVALADDSFARSNSDLRAPPKSNPPAPFARPPSARPSTAGSNGRPRSPLGSAPSDDYADLLGPGSDKSSASLPHVATPETPFGVATAAAATAVAPAAASSTRPPSAQSSARFSTTGSAAPPPAVPSRLGSLSGFGASSRRGSFNPGDTLPPPEASPSPRAAGSVTPTPRMAVFAAGTAGGGGSDGDFFGRSQRRSLTRSDKSRLSQVECHIPTPFELFRLYDSDFNGRVTREEFFSMLRDLDGHPLHFAPQDDPEHRLEGLRAKRRRKDAEREAVSEKLSLAEQQRQTPEAAKREMAEQVTKLAARVAELDAQIAEDEAEARRLAQHPDPEQRVTAEVRQHRAQWRKWVSEEFARSDLAGNGILSIDEFYMYFYSKLCFRFPVMRTGVNPGALLFNIFVRYCSIGRGTVGGRNEDMLSHQFAKLCREAGLINGKSLSRAEVDIIYHRARAADESLETYAPRAGVAATARMHYPQFLFALDKIADKRRSGFQEVVARLLATIETLPEPTFADFVIKSGNDLGVGEQVPEFLTRHPLLPDNSRQLRELADNEMIRKMKEESNDALALSMGLAPKSMRNGGLKAYLEARSRGEGGARPAADGNSNHGNNGGGRGGAASTLQASVYGSLPPPSLASDVLRQRRWERREPDELQQSRAAATSRGVAPVLSPECMQLVRTLDPDQLMASLKRVYEAYASWGGGVDRTALDRRRFAKALRDALLVSESGPLPTRKAEAVYDKVLPASSRALNFIQFIEALRHVALHHRLSLNEVMERLVAVGSPRPGP